MRMPDRHSAIALLASLFILTAVNLSIAGKERLLAYGRVVYLELVPVDPRSLMQGDYMALNYRVAETIFAALPHKDGQRGWRPELEGRDGHVVVALDGNSVARYARLDDRRELARDELRLRYRIRGGQLKFASNAYFFQEGTAKLYQDARFGQFRVASDGDLLLTALHDENLEKLGPE